MKTTIEKMKSYIDGKIRYNEMALNVAPENSRSAIEKVLKLYTEIKDQLPIFEEESDCAELDALQKQSEMCGDIAELFKGTREALEDITSEFRSKTLPGISEGEKKAIDMMAKARYKRPTENELNTNK